MGMAMVVSSEGEGGVGYLQGKVEIWDMFSYVEKSLFFPL